MRLIRMNAYNTSERMNAFLKKRIQHEFPCKKVNNNLDGLQHHPVLESILIIWYHGVVLNRDLFNDTKNSNNLKRLISETTML